MPTLNLKKTYQKYPEYKDSGANWLGQIPFGWEAKKIGGIFAFKNEKVSDKDFEPLSVTYGGIKKQLETAAKSDNGENRKKVLEGDIVINGRSDRKGALGVSSFKGSVSLIYHVLRSRDKLIETKYFHHLLRSNIFTEEFFRWGRGIVDDLWTTRSDETKKISIPFPIYQEQKQIADFLDTKTNLIDQIIEKKQRLISLLQEKRSALITHAVTKGLDPKVKMKASGIDWIDSIPSNWTLNKMKYLGKVIIGLTYSPEDVTDEEGTLVLRSSNIKDGHIVLNDNVYVTKKIPNKLLTQSGDILICSRNGSAKLVGKCAYIETKGLNVSFGAFMTIFRSKYGKYISSFLESNLFLSQLTTVSTSTINQLTTEYLNNVLVPTPPTKEQLEIVKAIEIKTKQIDKIMDDIDTQIKYLQEYRSSLIYHAVTGKIKI